MSGRLFIIATPVGNLGDISQRVKESLSAAELVLAEDTRVSIKLLNHLGLKKQLVSCHGFNETKRLSLLDELAQQDKSVALVSDAGTPLVSDPGFQIVKRAIDIGMQVVPVPGPSAFLLALIGSGLACDSFLFAGFLPDKTGDRRKKLEKLKGQEVTVIFFVSPHDLTCTLKDVLDIFGDRHACLARELTKLHEEFIRLPLSQLLRQAEENGFRGEAVLIVAGAPEQGQRRAEKEEVLRELSEYLDRGDRLKNASQVVAEHTGWSKSDVYKVGLEYISSRTPEERQ